MPKQFRISIPEPCHEPWGDMQPVSGGRFCASCRKCVTDFTALPDAEVRQLLQSGAKLCGRLTVEQLQRLNQPEEQPAAWWLKAAAALGLLAIATPAAAQQQPLMQEQVQKIQEETEVKEERQHAWQEQPPQQSKVLPPGTVIRGRVVDEQTNEVLPFATVQVGETEFSGQTDLDGIFIIHLPDSFDVRKQHLKVQTVGYFTERFLLSDLNLSDVANLKLKMQVTRVTTGVLVYERKPPLHRRTWWKLKHLFHKKT